MKHITIEDYQMILDLCFMMDHYEEQYRQRMLEILAERLGSGFHHLTFLTLDKLDKLGDPIGINKVQRLCDSYTKVYDRFDIFSDVCKPEKPIARAMSIEDIMSLREYEQTTFYNDFLRKENLYYELAVPLCYNNRLVGGLGLFREKKEGDFTPRDKEIVILLSRHLALSYHNSLKAQELDSDQCKLLKSYQKENLLIKLTLTERKIVSLVEKGMTNREIAKQNNISFHTVKAHLDHIYNKLEVHSRTEMLHRINSNEIKIQNLHSKT
ncbi:response regulator containing a CheY-like receiver domain and an HTH DNA-binding domain [Clostridium sp. ASBs410]|nr:response regulator containing a CheY-like receiver domain and an HTH DNA-binding domain [Clostridium sp. ASBs410]